MQPGQHPPPTPQPPPNRRAKPTPPKAYNPPMPRRPTGRPTGRPPYPGPLTPAEERVLALIRDGKTNPEVAAELGLGVATVKFHVSNMLRKLDLGSRDGLATWEPPPHAGGWRRYRVIALAARAGSARPAVAGVTGALAASLVVLSLFARPRSTESPRGAEVGLPSNGAPRIPSVLYVDWAPGGGGTLHAASPTTLTDLPGRSLPPFEYGVVGLVSPSTDLVALQTPTNAEQTESRIDIFATTSLQRVASPPLTAGSQPWPIAWSPDGQTLYYTLTPPSASPAIWRFDVRTAAADRLFAPAAGYVSSAWVSPDGSKLFLLLTGPSPGPSTDPGSGLLSVAALDAASGQVLGIRPLPDILWGARPIAGADPDSTPPEYFPAAVMAPDGAAIYIAHADRDAVTVVHLPDLATQTRAITNRRSILGRIGDALLGWLAGTAEAKGGESVQRRIATSADGSLLYIGGSRGSVSRGGCARVPVVTSC